MELKIRSAEYDDFKDIFELLKQLWPNSNLDHNQLFKVFKVGVESEMQKFIVGKINNKIIGFCSLTIKNNLWLAGNLGHIDELVIDVEYRGCGLGKRMIELMTKIAKESKCKRIELDTAFHRKKAHKFYESVGYENRAYLFSKKL